MTFQYVSYIVLLKFENNDYYDFHDKTGAVSYMSHWGISYCEKVGKMRLS